MNKLKADKKTSKRETAEKTAGIILITVFGLFLAVFFTLILILPKAEGELSPNERRILADAPKLTFDNLISGNFASETDVWLEDHFPTRNFFVSLYSYLNSFTGRNAAEKIIMGKNGRLFAAPIERNDERIKKNAETLKKFIEENNMDALSVIIPPAGFMLESELPKLHLNYPDGEVISEFNSFLGGSADVLNVEALINSRENPSEYYYRTDHHLTMAGSYLIYTALAEKLRFDPLPESEFQKTSYEFYGTSYGRSGLMLTPPDALEIWLREGDGELSVTTLDGRVQRKYAGSIDRTCLAEGVADKYAAYLYGNHGMTAIVNPNVEAGTLMLLKDSYANAVVPFLTAHYHEIIMIDTRHYNSDMEKPGAIAERLGINAFIILCGTDTVNEALDFGYMR